MFSIDYIEYYYYLNAPKEVEMPIANVLPEIIAKSNIFQFTTLPNQIKTFYKSAGILPYARKNENETVFLLGRDTNLKTNSFLKGGETRNKIFCWSEFGGKIEPIDSSVEDTAIREFNEETNNLFISHKETFLKDLRSEYSNFTNPYTHQQ